MAVRAREAQATGSDGELSSRERVVFWALILLVAASRGAIALANHKSLMATGIYQDDAFYYLKIAQNVVQGRGMTFDGLAPTSSFHPLYLLLLLPVMAFSGGSLTAPIHASELILAAVAVGTAFLVFALARTWMGTRGAFLCLALFAVSPYFLVFGANGLETGLAMFFVLAVVLVYVRWFAEDGTASPRKCVAFGVVSGLAVLARFDLVLLLVGVAADWLWVTATARARRAVFRCALVAGGTALALWIPWGAFSRAKTGNWTPASGSASRQIALAFGWQNLDSVWTPRAPDRIFFDPDDVPPLFYADVATRLGFVFLHEYPPLAPLRAGAAFDVWPQLSEYAPYASFKEHRAAGLGLLVATTAGVVWMLRRRGDLSPAPRDASRSDRLVVVFLVLAAFAYTFLVPVHWYVNRYLVPPILLVTIHGLARLAEATSGLRGRRAGARASAWGGAALLLACQLLSARSLAAVRWDDVPAAGPLADWERVAPLVDRERRIGAFQAGIYGWFSGLDVVNLDGKVNAEAFRAIREGRLPRYLEEREIRYVVEWEWVFYAMCGRHLREGELRIRRLVEGEGPNDASLYLIGP